METINNLIVRLYVSSCPDDLRDAVVERLQELVESRIELDAMAVKLNSLRADDNADD